MIEEAVDFRNECDELFNFLKGKMDRIGDIETQFKQWTPNEILRHLHIGDEFVGMSLVDPEKYKEVYKQGDSYRKSGRRREYESLYFNGLKGEPLLAAWYARTRDVADSFQAADPKLRMVWSGPSISARSSIGARVMETWAHAQAIYDLLGVVRTHTDRIRSVAVLGVNTFGWTFVNRGMTAPPQRPNVKLAAPSGADWNWLNESSGDAVEGDAAEFCQVVAQTRNIADTRLRVTGDVATQWMALAQCFAGPPNPPPAPGTRFVNPTRMFST